MRLFFALLLLFPFVFYSNFLLASDGEYCEKWYEPCLQIQDDCYSSDEICYLPQCSSPCIRFSHIAFDAGAMEFYKQGTLAYGSIFNGVNAYTGPAIENNSIMWGPYVGGLLDISFCDFFETPCVRYLNLELGGRYFTSDKTFHTSDSFAGGTLQFSSFADPLTDFFLTTLAGVTYNTRFERTLQDLSGYIELSNCLQYCGWLDFTFEPIIRFNVGRLRQIFDFTGQTFTTATGAFLGSTNLNETLDTIYYDIGGGIQVATSFWNCFAIFAKALVFYEFNDHHLSTFQTAVGTTVVNSVELDQDTSGYKFIGETGLTACFCKFDLSFIAGFEYWESEVQGTYPILLNIVIPSSTGPSQFEKTSFGAYRFGGRIGYSF